MIEISIFEGISILAGTFVSGIGLGYKAGFDLGKANANKIITTLKSVCHLTIDKKQRNISVEKILINGIYKSTTCSYMVNKKCELTDKKCKHY